MPSHSVEGVEISPSLRLRPSVQTNIRVVILSSVHLVSEGLAATLRRLQGVTVLDAIDLSGASIERISDAKPDIVLVDLGHTDPAAAARLIRAADPDARLMVFALDETDELVFACAAAGYCGYVPRESGTDQLHRALMDAVAGRMHCAPHIAAAMFRRLTVLLKETDPRRALPSLSARENEILALVNQNRSNKEIARQLAISAATVKNHLHNILQKLQVSRRGEAAARLRLSNAA
jgi:two-component system nitrate/nitrite response regulator NarL